MTNESPPATPTPKTLPPDDCRLRLDALFEKYPQLGIVSLPAGSPYLVARDAAARERRGGQDGGPEGAGTAWTVKELTSLFGPAATLNDVIQAFTSPPPDRGPQPTKPQPATPDPEPAEDPLIAAARPLVGDARLTAWEATFLPSVLDQFDRRGTLTDKQRASLERLVHRLRKAA